MFADEHTHTQTENMKAILGPAGAHEMRARLVKIVFLKMRLHNYY